MLTGSVGIEGVPYDDGLYAILDLSGTPINAGVHYQETGATMMRITDFNFFLGGGYKRFGVMPGVKINVTHRSVERHARRQAGTPSVAARGARVGTTIGYGLSYSDRLGGKPRSDGWDSLRRITRIVLLVGVALFFVRYLAVLFA